MRSREFKIFKSCCKYVIISIAEMWWLNFQIELLRLSCIEISVQCHYISSRLSYRNPTNPIEIPLTKGVWDDQNEVHQTQLEINEPNWCP